MVTLASLTRLISPIGVEAKKNVVKRFNHSSYYIGRRIAAAGKTVSPLNMHRSTHLIQLVIDVAGGDGLAFPNIRSSWRSVSNLA